VATDPGDSFQAFLISSRINRPLFVTAPPLDTHRIFVVEKTGAIRVVKNDDLLMEPFLTVAVSNASEQGLLGLAFHPDYERNGRFFINYTNPAGDTVIARYQVSADPDRADQDSGRILLTIDQPAANHNGGHLAFGPDGYLYVGMGDGGGFNDPREAGQDDATLLGKMLRFDVDFEEEPYYAIPPSNPRASEGRPLGLIWSKGWRNPWRYAFDRLTDDLFVGDVGQNAIEEIDVQPANSVGGENYGWDIFEGSACFEPRPLFPECPSPPTEYTMPVLEYGHGEGCSVTGGYVYRGCAGPNLHGTYFYADFCTNYIRSFVLQDGRPTAERDWTATLAPGAGINIGAIASFGEDARGELYICDLSDNEVFKLVPVTAGARAR
jgi:glucose/arabinose dehydrogenase